VVEGVSSRDVIHKKGSGSTSVVWSGDWSKRLLSCLKQSSGITKRTTALTSLTVGLKSAGVLHTTLTDNLTAHQLKMIKLETQYSCLAETNKQLRIDLR